MLLATATLSAQMAVARPEKQRYWVRLSLCFHEDWTCEPEPRLNLNLVNRDEALSILQPSISNIHAVAEVKVEVGRENSWLLFPTPESTLRFFANGSF